MSDFADPDDVGTPPPSALYRPSGEPAGSTRADAGEVIVLEGYSAIVPNKMRAVGGSFTVRVPCQRWDLDETGKRAWGEQVIATWGPVPLPPPGAVVTDRGLGIPLGGTR